MILLKIQKKHLPLQDSHQVGRTTLTSDWVGTSTTPLQKKILGPPCSIETTRWKILLRCYKDNFETIFWKQKY